VHFARYQASGNLPERHPSGSLAVVLFQAIDTADGQVIVAAANDRLWAKFCGAVGRPEWATDARYRTNADRFANKDELVAAVTEIMRQRPSEEWVARLEKVGVPCAPINDLAHMKAHPQTAALGMVQRVAEIDLELMSLPLTFGGERPTIRSPAPKLGEHNEAVRAPSPSPLAGKGSG
jgi:crotonobetainyl-CoA:carnitine CoA-transferase CaiB-like acyl-CoA transferase